MAGEGMNAPSRWLFGLAAVLVGVGCGAATAGTSPAPEPRSNAVAQAGGAPTAHVYLGTVYRLPPLPSSEPVPATQPSRSTRLDPDDESLDELLANGALDTLGGGRVVRIGSTKSGVALRKPAPQPQVLVRPPTSSGSLDKSIISRVVRRSLPRLRHCYETQLRRNPNLDGTVVARFAIDGQGAVINASAQGINATMETCVVGVLKTLRFPKPPSGGLVVVSYPLVFKPAVGGPAPIAQPIERGCTPVDTGGEKSSFYPVVASATSCYQAALARAPGLRGRVLVELVVDAEGAIADVAVDAARLSTRDPLLETCIANAALAVSLTGDQRVALTDHRALFTLGLLRTPEPVAGLAPEVITLTPSEVHLGLRLLGSEVPFDRDGAPQRAVWRQIAGALEGHQGPVEVRIDDRVDSLAVEMALRMLPSHRKHLRFARALPDEPRTWQVVNPLGDIDLRGHCDGPPEGRVSVLVAADGYWVGTEKGYEHVPAPGKRFDTIAFGRHLRELRRFELAGRSDLEIAASVGTPYEALAKAVDIAFETGFTDVRVLRVSELRDPRHSRRRSR